MSIWRKISISLVSLFIIFTGFGSARAVTNVEFVNWDLGNDYIEPIDSNLIIHAPAGLFASSTLLWESMLGYGSATTTGNQTIGDCTPNFIDMSDGDLLVCGDQETQGDTYQQDVTLANIVSTGDLDVGGSATITDDLYVGGSLGINTSTPANLLAIQATSNSQEVIGVSNLAGTRISTVFSDSTGDGILTVKDSSGATKAQLHSNGTSYLTGGSVGVGTDSPDAKLAISDTERIVLNVLSDNITDTIIQIKNTDTNGRAWQLRSNADGDFEIFDGSPGGGDRFHIASTTGNIGIGTNNPLELLQIGDNSAGDKFIAFQTDNGSERGLKYYITDGTERGYVKWDVSEDLLLKGDELKVSTQSQSDALVVDVSGDVALTDTLKVGGNVIQFSESRGFVYNLALDTIGFSMDGNLNTDLSGSVLMVNTSDVGIGKVPDSGVKLEVLDSAAIIRISDSQNKTWSPPEISSALEFYSSDVSANFPAVGAKIAMIVESAGGAQTGMGFFTNNNDASGPTQQMHITNAGNVGIGTSTPDTILHAVDSTGADITLTRADNTITAGEVLGSIFFSGYDVNVNAIPTATIEAVASTDWSGPAPIIIDTDLVFKTTFLGIVNEERMRITNEGDVGINTDSPATTLEVFGHASTTQLTVGDGGATFGNATTTINGGMDLNGSNIVGVDNLTVSNIIAGSDLNLFGSAFIFQGIEATTTMSMDVDRFKLETINASVQIDAGKDFILNVGESYDAMSPQFSFLNTNSNNMLDMNTDTITIGSGDVNILTQFEGAGDTVIFEVDPGVGIVQIGKDVATTFAVNNDAIYVNKVSDWVGIGTTTPDSILHVSSVAPRIRISTETNNDLGDLPKAQVGFGLFGDNVWDIGYDALITNPSPDHFFIRYNNSDANKYFTVNTAGNVGINTTTPEFKLVVDTGSLIVDAGDSACSSLIENDGTMCTNELIVIDQDSVSAQATSTIAVANGDWTTIEWDVVSQSGLHTTLTTDEATTTIGHNGDYALTAGFFNEKTGGAAHLFEASFFVNNTQLDGCNAERTVNANNETGDFDIDNCIVTLSASDLVTVKVGVNGAFGQLNRSGTLVDTPISATMSINKVK